MDLLLHMQILLLEPPYSCKLACVLHLDFVAHFKTELGFNAMT